MAFRQAFWVAAAVVAAGAAYSAYAPETAEKWAPALGVYARRAPALVMVGNWALAFQITPRNAPTFNALILDQADG